MVDHLFIDVTLLKRPIVYLENGRPLQTTTAEGVDMNFFTQVCDVWKSLQIGAGVPG